MMTAACTNVSNLVLLSKNKASIVKRNRGYSTEKQKGTVWETKSKEKQKIWQDLRDPMILGIVVFGSSLGWHIDVGVSHIDARAFQ